MVARATMGGSWLSRAEVGSQRQFPGQRLECVGVRGQDMASGAPGDSPHDHGGPVSPVLRACKRLSAVGSEMRVERSCEVSQGCDGLGVEGRGDGGPVAVCGRECCLGRQVEQDEAGDGAMERW